MAQTNYETPNYPTPDEVLNGILSALRYSYARDGIAVNVLPGSDHWRRAKVLADQVSIAIANNRISVSALNPLYAQGQDLVDWCEVFDVPRRPASGAAGNVYCYGASGSVVAIPAGFQGTLPNGTKFRTVGASIVTLAGNDTTPSTPYVVVQAIKGGVATNAKPNTVAQWDSAALAMLAQRCVVDAAGLTGGTDEDDQETMRERLLRKLATPAIGGNWAHVKQLAEGATSAVEAAYVYPAMRGPGSCDVAVTQAGAARALSSAHVTTARTAVRSKMPGFASYNVTTVHEQAIDVVLDMRLPLPASAGGSGGGWKDARPWPSNADSVLCQVMELNVGGPSIIRVNATSADAPLAGNRVMFWNAAEQAFDELTIVTVAGSSGSYVIALDRSLPTRVSVGAYVSASAEDSDAYAADYVAQIRALGPGEKTADPRLMPRARRQPPPDTDAAASITEIQTAAVIASHREILGLSYAARFATGTTTPQSSPTLPALTKDPPNILVLGDLAIRRMV